MSAMQKTCAAKKRAEQISSALVQQGGMKMMLY